MLFNLNLHSVADNSIYSVLIRYLTSNLLSGPVPDWVNNRDTKQYVSFCPILIDLIIGEGVLPSDHKQLIYM